MSKQTLHNMKLIILEMEKQIGSNMGDFKALKALSHSYETLLMNLSHGHEDLKDNKLTSEIESQQKAIIKLNFELESKSIPELLKLGSYLEVNHLATTNARLLNTNNVLERLLYQLYKSYNKKVLIIANDYNKAYGLFDNNLTLSKERLVDIMHHSPTRMTAITNKHIYETVKFNSSHRGKRVDYAIIDSELTIDEINIVKTHLKDKNEFRMF